MGKYDILTETMLGFSYEEVEQCVRNNAVVLFPIGVVEAHGPHMTLGTDIFIALDQAIEVKKELMELGHDAVVVPPYFFGGTDALTRQFAGTFTSDHGTIVRALMDIVASLDRFGFTNVIFINAHGDPF